MPDVKPHLEHYAAALLALGQASHNLQTLCDEFGTAAELVAGNEAVRRFLADPRVQINGKRAALEELIEAQVDPAVLTLLLTMQANGHLGDAKELAELVRSRMSSLDGKLAGEVVSAAPLSDPQVAAIHAEASRILKQTVDLRIRIDPTLLGGVRLRVGSFVMDGTVEHQLKELRDTLLA